MLDQARRNGFAAHWHVIDEAGPVPEPVPVDGPAVVTVFRLLLNVDDAVRDRAVAFAAKALPMPDSGLLIVQNHGSARSLRHLRHRRHADNRWYTELSDEQVTTLLERHGLALVARRGCGMFPRGWYRPKVTRPLVRRLDDMLCAMRVFDRWAVDVLYIARPRRTGSGTDAV